MLTFWHQREDTLSQEKKKLQPVEHHWHVSTWVCIVKDNVYEIRIRVSRKFLEASFNLSMKMGMKNCQIHPRILAHDAGVNVSNGDNILLFGDYGLRQINCPRHGECYLVLVPNSTSENGAEFRAFGCSDSIEQSFLMSVWTWWAEKALEEVKKIEQESARVRATH